MVNYGAMACGDDSDDLHKIEEVQMSIDGQPRQ